MMVVEVEFSMGNNFLKSCWRGIIRGGYGYKEGGKWLNDGFYMIRRTGKNLWLVSSCPLIYLPATTKHSTVVGLCQSFSFPFLHPFPISIVFIMGSWQIAVFEQKGWQIDPRTWVWTRVPPYISCMTWRSFFMSLISGFLICSKGRTAYLTSYIGCVQMK